MKIYYFDDQMLEVISNCKYSSGQATYAVSIDSAEDDLVSKIDRDLGLSDDTDFQEDGEIELDSSWFSSYSREALFSAMTLLPEKEADYIYLYYFMTKTQCDIASMFNVTQGDISYRLSKAVARLRFVLDRPEVEVSVIVSFLSRFVFSKLDIELMSEMWYDTSYAGVSRKIGVDQGKVRYKFNKNVDKMVEMIQAGVVPITEEDRAILNTFSHLRDNSCILKELRSEKRWSKNVYNFVCEQN